MNSEFLKTLEDICWFCGTLAAVVAAWFKLRSTWLSKSEDREALQGTYLARWRRLQAGGFLQLPERGVRWLLQLRSKARIGPGRLFIPLEWFSGLPTGIAVSVVLIPGVIAGWVLYGSTVGIVAAVVVALAFALVGTQRLGTPPDWVGIALVPLVVGYVLFYCVVVLQLAVSLGVYWSVLLLLLVLPLYGHMASLLVFLSLELVRLFKGAPRLREVREETAAGLGAALSLSFLVTAVALLVGSIAVPSAEVPQTAQMFLVNVLCDGITLVMTYMILERAVDKTVLGKGPSWVSSEPEVIRRKYPIPVAILLDISVAAMLACLSLYLGLLGTERAITIREAVNVLVALAPAGTTYELGPFFWAMHTTFIPTLMYLTVIVLAYIGKLIVLPVFHVLKKGHELEKPHDLTAAVFAFVAVVFVAIGGLLGRITPDQVTPV